MNKWETISAISLGILNVSIKAPKIKSNWWYVLPIFLGVVGGVVGWVAIKNYHRNLAKNCLILGVIFTAIEVLIFVTLLMFSENLHIISEFNSISETDDFVFQFKFTSP